MKRSLLFIRSMKSLRRLRRKKSLSRKRVISPEGTEEEPAENTDRSATLLDVLLISHFFNLCSLKKF